MGISPISDFVVDVMQNAETSRVRQVVGKLKALSTGGGADFSATMTKTGASDSAKGADTAKGAAGLDEDAQAKSLAMIPAGVAFSGTSLTTLRNAHALSGRSVDQFAARPSPPPAALKKFEGMVLANFLDTMMPQTDSVFGSGTAGSAWKTMLTEKIGDAIANAGGIGIAQSIARAAGSRYADGKTGESS
ncbi:MULTISPECIES: rod-binding protein [unclassified Xanthobacter]|uniref:rod-binding protein n=1 Tax=unclassified Xanthobacter TaxID=2623496 RepID=UPI001F180B02|nr:MULTISPECIES: rod-binding protein [unclassified Xanthobacter]